MAAEADAPLSRYNHRVIKGSLSEETDFKPRGELVKEIGKLRSENKGFETI